MGKNIWPARPEVGEAGAGVERPAEGGGGRLGLGVAEHEAAGLLGRGLHGHGHGDRALVAAPRLV